jgi:hypothetical protein
MPQAFFPSRWAFKLVWLQNHIVVHLQMPYQVVFGHIKCIAPSTLQANVGPSLAQWTPSRATEGRATTFETKITKQKTYCEN